MGYASDKSVEDKLLWILDNGLLYAPGMKHEIFQLLIVAYPNSNGHTRTTFMDAVMQQSINDFIEISEEIAAYERYNLLIWLSQVDPSCKLVEQYLGTIQQAYPSFIGREHPDLEG